MGTKQPETMGHKHPDKHTHTRMRDMQNIVGEVWSVDQQKLDFLDEFETYPTYYDRLKIPVHLLPPPDDDGGQGRDEEHVTDLRLSDNEGVGKNMVWPMLYVMRAFKPELLSLPFHADYDSYGSHGLPYVERLQRTGAIEHEHVKDETQRTILETHHAVEDIR